jgi:hypothetical protein
MFLLPGFYFVFILYKEIYIVQSVHQAVFLVGIDFKMLALARGLVGNGLFGQVHFHFRFGIGKNRVEKLITNKATGRASILKSMPTRNTA